MFQSFLLLALISSAVAFVPIGRVSKPSISIKMGYESEIGAIPPVGFWDPLGLSKGIDDAKFLQYRTAELKHGRVAMAAVTGYVVAEFVRWPGYISPADGIKFADVPNGIGAFTAIPFLGWVQLILLVGWLETILKQEEGESYPGSFGTGYFTEFGRVGKLSGEKKVEKLTKELQNGRLAMLAIIELLTHDVAKPAGESVLALHHF